MRYVKSRFVIYDREEAYRIYVTKALELYGKLNVSYLDLFKPKETRTGDEIIESFKKGLGALGGK